MSKKHKGNWIVRVRATVTKDVYCEDCTEDEARSDPFNHAENEEEVEQVDWSVVDVQSNE